MHELACFLALRASMKCTLAHTCWFPYPLIREIRILCRQDLVWSGRDIDEFEIKGIVCIVVVPSTPLMRLDVSTLPAFGCKPLLFLSVQTDIFVRKVVKFTYHFVFLLKRLFGLLLLLYCNM